MCCIIRPRENHGGEASFTYPKGFGQVPEKYVTRWKPCLFEIIHHVDGWGWLPVNGSGRTGYHKVPCGIEEAKGKPIILCTDDERLEFLRQHYPTSYEWEIEQRAASLNSASL